VLAIYAHSAEVDGTRIMLFRFDHDPPQVHAFGAISGSSWQSAMRGCSKPAEQPGRQSCVTFGNLC
jgi:hypothetical protein